MGARVFRLSTLLRLGALAAALATGACGGSIASRDNVSLAVALAGPATTVSSTRTTGDQWNAVLARFSRQESDPAALCSAGTARAQCPAARWSALIAELSRLPLRDRVIRANAILNRVPDVPTSQNWGTPIYWETPYEFLAKGGQCEDYAIAKFLALAQSGVPESALHFVVVHDSVSHLDHAITLVTVDGEDLVLDNQAIDALPAASVARYTPYYSENETGIRVYARPTNPAAIQIALRPGGGFSVPRQ